ncbi:MAG: DUF935 domain-containing protein, partial [candidate division Zixibacteria bacterium]|nr:DUF935 domain-containing protein [candidate division Zixibacteria bacterium]
WDLLPASHEPKDIAIRDFVRFNFDGLPGGLNSKLYKIMSAFDFGYSVTEKLWARRKSEPYSSSIQLADLKTKDPELFRFNTDSFGNLTKTGVHHELTSEDLNTDKFVIFSYNSEFGNWYGDSDLRAAYRSWWYKDTLMKFWGIFLERFGAPTTLGKLPSGVKPEIKQAFETIMDKIQFKTGITLPEGFDISLLESKRSGDTFRDAIEAHNSMIARSILAPDLLGFSKQSFGSYAMARTQFQVFLWVLEYLGRVIEEEVIEEQIIRPLVFYNYGPNVRQPVFKFKPLTLEGKKELAQIFLDAVKGKIITATKEDEIFLRSIIGFPPPSEATVPATVTGGE